MYRPSSHSCISAFRPHANADEDWTKISDLKARWRIQNRIAQRNYRKKPNRRLEGSGYRAASLASPEDSHTEPVAPPKAAPSKPRTRQSRACKATKNRAHTAHAPAPERPASYDYYTTTQDDRGMFGQHCLRQLSASPSQLFSYPPLSIYDPYRPSYGQIPDYHTVPSSYGDIFLTDYSEAVPSVVPRVNNRGICHKPYDEDMMSPFCMSYATMVGADVEQNLPVHFPSMRISTGPRES